MLRLSPEYARKRPANYVNLKPARVLEKPAFRDHVPASRRAIPLPTIATLRP